MPLDAPVTSAVPLVSWVLISRLLSGWCPGPSRAGGELGPSRFAVYLAKSRDIFPNLEETHGSLRSHVHRVGRRRARHAVGGGAAPENAAGHREPQGVRARSAPADQTVHPDEPRAGPH